MTERWVLNASPIIVLAHVGQDHLLHFIHVIRNERELQAIRRCIRLNPNNWALDHDSPDNIHCLSSPETVEDYVHKALTETEMA